MLCCLTDQTTPCQGGKVKKKKRKEKKWGKGEETLGNPDTIGKICLCFKNIWKRVALITENKLETCPS